MQVFKYGCEVRPSKALVLAGKCDSGGARRARSAIGGAAAILAALATGCGASADVSTDDELEIGQVTSALVGTPIVANAAETQVDFGASSFVTAYNATDFAHIAFTQTDRFIYAGASGTGFSKCTGSSCIANLVPPPAGWAATWGDPALSGRSGYEVLSSLAIPNEKMPSPYIQGAVNPSGLPANFGGAYIGGICVARSNDGGGSLYRTDCMRKTSTAYPYGVFNDGNGAFTNGVSPSSGSGPAYAATNDVTNSVIDVYLSTGKNNGFVRMPTPFSGLFMETHPRLLTNSLGYVYVMAQDSSGRLLISKFSGYNTVSGSWSTPTVIATGVAVFPDVALSDRTIRNGPQYSGTFGSADYVGGPVTFRAIYTVKVSGHLHIRGAQCDSSLVACTAISGWSTDSQASDQFNPLMAYWVQGTPPNKTGVFKVSYYSRQNFPTGNKIQIMAGRFIRNSGGSSTFQTATFVDPQVPCPDLRGYFGDYDDFKFDPVTSKFGRTYADSTGGTCNRIQYFSSPLGVSVAYASFP